MIPPSPLLSACTTMARYLIEMTIINAQKMRERIPRTFGMLGQFRNPHGSIAEARRGTRSDVAEDYTEGADA